MPSQCRFCRSELVDSVVDLGLSPIANEFRESATAAVSPQTYYPLKVMVCDACWLVQLSDVETPSHFNESYAYFSSYSRSWLDHAQRYASRMIEKLSLDAKSQVVEIGSNDGYLLQYFNKAGIPVLGVEPSANVAGAARDKHDIRTIVEFFDVSCADRLNAEGCSADLMVANNVLAHVPDINGFVAGFQHLLRPNGTITFEFPHLLRLLELCQFDTVYHEHFSYLSLGVVERVLRAHDLQVYAVEELETHGGSLRVYASHRGADIAADTDGARTRDQVRQDEASYGLETAEPYAGFADRVVRRKTEFVSFLIQARVENKKVMAYGAPAKGNTFLNYCGVGPELLAYTVDLNPYKQNKFLPGANIPIRTPDDLLADQPEYIVILPWNLRSEISKQLAEARQWGGKFVVAIPHLEIF